MSIPSSVMTQGKTWLSPPLSMPPHFTPGLLPHLYSSGKDFSPLMIPLEDKWVAGCLLSLCQPVELSPLRGHLKGWVWLLQKENTFRDRTLPASLEPLNAQEPYLPLVREKYLTCVILDVRLGGFPSTLKTSSWVPLKMPFGVTLLHSLPKWWSACWWGNHMGPSLPWLWISGIGHTYTRVRQDSTHHYTWLVLLWRAIQPDIGLFLTATWILKHSASKKDQASDGAPFLKWERGAPIPSLPWSHCVLTSRLTLGTWWH